MSKLSRMLRDDSAVISMHMRREAAAALDAMESALKAIMSITSRQSAIWAIASQTLAKLEGK